LELAQDEFAGFGSPGLRDQLVMPASAAEHALIRAYIACNLAREALPELPQATAAAVEDAVRTFCNVVGEELRRTHPNAIHPAQELTGP
jgi:hypothetical protein